MSGLQNTFKRGFAFSQGQGYRTSQERHAKRTAQQKAVKDEIYANAQMPDEEQVKRNERRKSARRRGSRVSTVLTEQDTLGG